jgi:crotonobetainyl-CoA:carnitine CoA-transferase CaiB-like acyl-CoA transferase
LSQGLAGPSCGGYLAEYGADVIKLEPPEGDWARPLGASIDGGSGMSFAYNRGKRSLCLDLKKPEALAIARTLASRSDVFMQSARPGALERLGLGFDDVRTLRPNVVYLSVSGYGISGPNGRDPLTDTAAQAFAGIMAANTGRDGIPHKVGSTIVDNATGLFAFQAVTMALWGRDASTPAVHLDVNLMQAAAALQAHCFVEHSFLGRTPEALNPPAGTFPTADGWIAVTLVTEAHWQRICTAIGRPDVASDPRYATFADRRRNLAALRELLDTRFRQRSTAAWIAELRAADVLASPVNDYGAVMRDPHVVAVDAIPTYEVAPGITVRAPRTPAMPAYPVRAPRLGEHTRAVLREAGASDAEIDRLVAQGIAREAEPQRMPS